VTDLGYYFLGAPSSLGLAEIHRALEPSRVTATDMEFIPVTARTVSHVRITSSASVAPCSGTMEYALSCLT